MAMARPLLITWLGLSAMMLSASAGAVELPTKLRKQDAPAKAQSCEIDGHEGVLIAGSNACIRISGYVSAGVTGGNLKPANPH